MRKLLIFDPDERLTVEEALNHPYLALLHDVDAEPICSDIEIDNFGFDLQHGANFSKEDIKFLICKEIARFNPDLQVKFPTELQAFGSPGHLRSQSF